MRLFLFIGSVRGGVPVFHAVEKLEWRENKIAYHAMILEKLKLATVTTARGERGNVVGQVLHLTKNGQAVRKVIRKYR
jgi:hypothetical protein